MMTDITGRCVRNKCYDERLFGMLCAKHYQEEQDNIQKEIEEERRLIALPRDELLKQLEELKQTHDPEDNHVMADDLLYIRMMQLDPVFAQLYELIRDKNGWWYS